MADPEDIGLLQGFREQWLEELAQRNPNQEGNKPSRSPDLNHQQDPSESSCPSSTGPKIDEEFHPAFRNELNRENEHHELVWNANRQLTNNTNSFYYPFNIVDNLIQSASSNATPVGIRSKSCNNTGEDTLVKNTDSERKRTRTSKCFESIAKKARLKDVFSAKNPSQEYDSKERLLDLFIADVDEITEIPFFDLSVPREVAVKIFQYLDMVALCRCAQVSTSWRSLAEDELLWCRISHKLGYNQEQVTKERISWKNIVKQNLENRRCLIANWKGHLGEVKQLQHVSGGILCSVDSVGGTIVAGYKNCDVKMWNIEDGDECTFKPSTTSLLINEALEEGTISNYVECVAVSPTLVAASYHQGNVDIWRTLADFGTVPVFTFRDDTHRVSNLCVTHFTDTVVASAGPYIHVCQSPGQEENEVKTVFGAGQKVSMIKVVEQRNEEPCIAIATNNIVNLCSIKEPQRTMTEIHNIIDCYIYCLDLRTAPSLLAVGLFDKVKLYDLNSTREITTVYGHTHRLTCIDINSSPENHMVTGSGDRKVRVYDLRLSQPVSTFSGHLAAVTTIQMDDWKVVSGGEDGFVCLWDRRMASKLWDMHSRHPIRHCKFTENLLVAGNVPTSKFPIVDEFENITHRRYRGEIQVYNFQTNQLTEGVPEICLSTYDEPHASNYNMDLVVPYDAV